MPIKDPTSDMAIISRKGSTLVREIHEKQNTNKSRQRFWELAGSKLGDILGVEKTTEQVRVILLKKKMMSFGTLSIMVVNIFYNMIDRCRYCSSR